VNQDPIGLLGGENLYAFAPNTGSWIDPSGNLPILVVMAVGALMGGLLILFSKLLKIIYQINHWIVLIGIQ
jgi:RHS family protein (fragment)